jgi:dienelactone hydrolase
MIKKKNIALTSIHNDRNFVADVTYLSDGKKKPVIVFNHGFKGFKDWGPFDLVANKFAHAGFVFIKMNFSHNGVTAEEPRGFVDLDAFAQNNFCKELDDTGVLLDQLFLEDLNIEGTEIELDRCYQIGHSRGGAHVLLKAMEDKRIKAVATWAAVNDLEKWHSPEQLKLWKQNGRIFIHNARTNQQMPMDYQLVENYYANKERLNVPQAVKKLQIPMLAIHGTDDPTVPVEAVMEIGSWNSDVRIEIIEGAGHTFGGTHPFNETKLPLHLDKVTDLTIDFLRNLG